MLELAQGSRRGRKADRPGGRAGPGQGSPDGTVQRSEEPATPTSSSSASSTDIDDIVKKVRFPDWQHTSQGERLVQKELRRTLLKYKLHTDQELFDKAYGYIRQYY